MAQQRRALFVGDRADPRGRRAHPGALDDAGPALLVEHRDQALADAQLGDRLLGVDRGVLAHGARRGAHRLLVARRVGAQRVLDPVAELAQHRLRNVERILGHEEHAHALGADQPDHLLDLVEQRLGRVVEQQVGLVEEEDHLGLVAIADLGQALEELGQQPEQEAAVELGRVQQPVGGQDVHHAAPLGVGLHQVVDVQHRLAEEAVGALLVEHQQRALDRADRRGRHVAVAGGELARVLAHELQHRAQVLGVEQQHPLLVGDLEDQVQHAFLGLVQAHHPRQQQRPHVGHGGAQRMALLAVDVPERDRDTGEGGHLEAEPVQALLQLGRGRARLRQAGQVALDVGQEHRHADGRETLGEHLQRDRLAGAGRPGDQAVAVGERREQVQQGVAVAGNEEGLGHGLGAAMRAGRMGGEC